jgi:hypothetical protein
VVPLDLSNARTTGGLITGGGETLCVAEGALVPNYACVNSNQDARVQSDL